jgi:hypothetical protein
VALEREIEAIIAQDGPEHLDEGLLADWEARESALFQ